MRYYLFNFNINVLHLHVRPTILRTYSSFRRMISAGKDPSICVGEDSSTKWKFLFDKMNKISNDELNWFVREKLYLNFKNSFYRILVFLKNRMTTKFDSSHKLQVTSDHIPLTIHSAGVVSSCSVGQMRVTATTSGRCYAALRRYWNMQVVWIDWKMRTASCNGCFMMTAQPFGNHGTRCQRRSSRQFLMPLTCGQMKYGVNFQIVLQG